MNDHGDTFLRARNHNDSHNPGIVCPPPTLKSSASLGTEALLESRRSLGPSGFSQKFAAFSSHVGLSPMNHTMTSHENLTDLRRKVTTNEDEVERYPTTKKAAPTSQTDEASLAEAIKQYDIARLNLEAQLKARTAGDEFAASNRIKKDLCLTGPFESSKGGLMSVPSPPTLSRKSSITPQTRSVGLEKIRRTAAVIENAKNKLTKPHRSDQGFHGTLCLKSNLVEEDGEEDDDTALHVGFSDQWDDVLMNRAIQESKMTAMSHLQQSSSTNKQDYGKTVEERKKKLAKPRLGHTQVALPQNTRAATWSPLGHVNSKPIPSANQSAAINNHINGLNTGAFDFQNHIAVPTNGANNRLMDLLASGYRDQMNGVDQTNAALNSLLSMNPYLGFPNSQINPIDANTEKILKDFIKNSYPLNTKHSSQANQRFERTPILESILQKHNLAYHDFERLFNIASLLSYSPSDILSIFDTAAPIHNAFPRTTEESGIGTRLPNHSQINLPTINDTLSTRERNHLTKKRPCRNLSSICLMCGNSLAFNDTIGEKEIVCNSCSFLHKKKSKPNLSDSDYSMKSHEEPTKQNDEKWDTIPSNARLILATDQDSIWLSDLLCFIRRQIEVFTATPSDVCARSRRGGIKQPIAVGRVGIRCTHCRHVDPDRRAKGAVSYPNSIRIVHQAIRNWQRYHFMECNHISDEIRKIYYSFKTTRSHSGNASLKYWVTSCQKLGMVDTNPEDGIRFRDPTKSKAFSESSPSCPNLDHMKNCNCNHLDLANDHIDAKFDKVPDDDNQGVLPYRALPDSLLEPGEDKTISPFLATLLAQQQPTHYTSIDKMGKRKSRPINFPGVQCRHCNSRVAGSGRYFPLTVTTFANNNNPNNCIHTHMMKCSRCPQEIKDKLMILENRHAIDTFKFETGWKKKLFDRLWFRLHGKECSTSKENSTQVDSENCGTSMDVDSHSEDHGNAKC